MQYLPWFFFGCNTHKGLNDFFSQKLFKPRRPFFYTSKYGTWGFFRKKIKFFYPRVLEIFDSKHGSPENYSDFFFFEDIAMQYLPWFFFGCNTHKGPNDFFSQKLFKPRRPFFYTSIYGTWAFFRKKIKFFYSRVFEIFDSKHGSPENYSDFFCFWRYCYAISSLVLLRLQHAKGSKWFFFSETIQATTPIFYHIKIWNLRIF